MIDTMWEIMLFRYANFLFFNEKKGVRCTLVGGGELYCNIGLFSTSPQDPPKPDIAAWLTFPNEPPLIRCGHPIVFLSGMVALSRVLLSPS